MAMEVAGDCRQNHIRPFEHRVLTTSSINAGSMTGTIRSDTDNNIRFGLFRGLIVTVKHIEEAAAREWDSAELAVFRDGVVGGVGCRGENRFGNGGSPRGPHEDALQHGLSGDVCKIFPGKREEAMRP